MPNLNSTAAEFVTNRKKLKPKKHKKKHTKNLKSRKLVGHIRVQISFSIYFFDGTVFR